MKGLRATRSGTGMLGPQAFSAHLMEPQVLLLSAFLFACSCLLLLSAFPLTHWHSALVLILHKCHHLATSMSLRSVF